MLYHADEGVYIFLFDTQEDASCFADHLEEDMVTAETFCEENYGISASEWQIIPDPEPGCYHDIIRPVPINPHS